MTKINMKSSSARLSLVAVALALLAAGRGHGQDHEHADSVPASLVQIVRTATERFLNVNSAVQAGYQPAFGCVSGPDHGAMGVHYINGGLVGDGEVDATRPEAMIYE